jgi:hypothetical protein
MLELIHEFDMHVEATSPDDVGAGPLGHRFIVNVTGGRVSGDRLRGSIIGASGDWILVTPDGFARLDVRTTVKTVDDAIIYFQYFGVAGPMSPGVQELLAGGGSPMDYGDVYFFINPRLETGDARYGWVNQTMFIGQGRLVPGPVLEYRVYRVH